MCGHRPCDPMTPSCTWSPEFRAECLQRYRTAAHLIEASAKDWNAAVHELRAYEQTHGKPQADKLRAEIKRLKNDHQRLA